MPDAVAAMRLGEKRPVYGTVAAGAGATISISSLPTVTVYDATGSPVPGLTGVPASDYNAGPSSAGGSLSAWYDWDTSQNGIADGIYRIVFDISAAGSDGIARVLAPEVEVVVGPAA